MTWEDVGRAVAKAAPMLGTVLGGPAGGAIGSIVASAFGVEDDPDAVAKAIEKDPQAAVKLRQIEAQNEADIRRHLLELARLRIEDLKSARQREVELARAGGTNLIQPLLATVGVGAFFAIVGYIIAFGLADMGKEASFIVGNLTGVAAAIAKDVFGYYFGSSQGSNEKTRLLAGGRNV